MPTDPGRPGSSLRTSLMLAAGAQVALLAGTFVRSKLFAVSGGPRVVGTIAQLSTATSLLATLAALGISNAGIRQLAACEVRDDEDGATRTAATMLFLPCVAGLVLTVAAGAGSRWLTPQLFGAARPTWWLPVAVASVPLALAGTAVTGVLQGRRRMATLARSTIVATTVGTAVAAPLIVSGRLGLMVVSLPVAALATSATLLVANRSLFVQVRPRQLLPRSQVRTFLRFGVASLSASALTLGADLAVRVLLVRHDGLSANGLYQPVFVLSAAGFAVLGNALATVMLPELSGLSARGADRELRDTLGRATWAAVAVTTAAATLVIAFSHPVLVLVSSGRFTSAAPVLGLQMVGEVPRILAYATGAVLLPEDRVGAWFACGASGSVVRIVTTTLLLPRMGLDALALSYVLEWSTVAAVAVFVTRGREATRCSAANLGLAGAGTALCLALALLGRSVSTLALASVGSVAVCVWATAIGLERLRAGAEAGSP